MGCTVRVGPVLGFTRAFVLVPDVDVVEPRLLLPWLDAREIRDGMIRSSHRHIISLFDDAGTLVDLLFDDAALWWICTDFRGYCGTCNAFAPRCNAGTS